MFDRRLFARYPIDNEIEVHFTGEGEKSGTETTILTDVSDEGLGFVTRQPERYQTGMKVSIQIFMSRDAGGKDLVIPGVVEWVSDPDISTCGEIVQPRVGIYISGIDLFGSLGVTLE